jgi:hypothetical protein
VRYQKSCKDTQSYGRLPIGLFAPDSRTVYVRGASFGDSQGINNITVLHEILHAATNQKISLGLLPWG